MVDILLVLGQQDLWEVRHATLMGLQHVLAARMVRSSFSLSFSLSLFLSHSFSLLLFKDVAVSLLPLVGDCILRGLQDSDDDVRAVAASSLLPVADQLHVTFSDKVSFCIFFSSVSSLYPVAVPFSNPLGLPFTTRRFVCFY